jgi:hypothetical protein
MLDKLNNIYVGLVVNNKDPKKRGRVQVFIPNITNTLYKNWNEKNTDIKYRTLDSNVFNSEITQRLIDVLPWSEVTMPFFGGGTGAPVNTKTNEPTPIPTGPVVSSPGEYMVGSDSTGTQIPKRNLSSNGTVDIDRLSPSLRQKMANFVATFPNAVITSGAEGKRGDGIHGLNSAHYPENNSDGYGRAIDLRIRDVDAATQQKYVEWLAQNGFKGIGWEGDHIHAQDTSTGGNNFTFGPTGSRDSLDQTPSWFRNFSNNFTKGTYAASSSATPTTAAQTGSMPTQNGINNTGAIVGNDYTGSVPIYTNKNGEQVVKTNELYPYILEQMKKNGDFFWNNPKGLPANAQRYALDNTPESWARFFSNIPNYETGNKISSSNNNDPGGSEGLFQLSTESARLWYDTNPTVFQKFGIEKRTYSKAELENPELNSRIGMAYAAALLSPSKDGKSNFIIDNGRSGDANGAGMSRGFAMTTLDKVANNNPNVLQDFNDKASYTKTDPQKLNMICSSFNKDNVGSGMSSIGSAGGPIGMFSIPQVGAKAYVMFLDGNPLQPIVLGCFQDPSNVG